jgi:hypothetical protein
MIIIVNTLAAIAGSWMFLKVKLKFPSSQSFGDLGYKVFGKTGQILGNLVQIGNFFLFLPCALLFTAEALQGIGKSWPSPFESADGAPCFDLYILLIAAVCYATTQARTLSNTAIFSAISVFCVFGIAITQLVAIAVYDVTEKKEAQLFGNPDVDHSGILFSRGASIAVFGYVPAFLTAELASVMKEPTDMTKAIFLSGALNVVMMLGVGIPVVLAWGYNMGYVVPLTGQFAGPGTAKVSAWDAGNATTNIINIFVLIGNFVSYMLDSVPLGRFCQRCWAPNFKDTWSCGDILKYMVLTLPTFLIGYALSFFIPSLDLLVNCLTFLTTPWVTMIFPAALYWKVFRSGETLLLSAENNGACDDGVAQTEKLERNEKMSLPVKIMVMVVFIIGVLGVAVSAIAAIGLLAIDGTAAWQIGCEGWYILKPSGR